MVVSFLSLGYGQQFYHNKEMINIGGKFGFVLFIGTKVEAADRENPGKKAE